MNKINNYAFLVTDDGRKFAPKPDESSRVSIMGEIDTDWVKWPFIVIEDVQVPQNGEITQEFNDTHWKLGEMSPAYKEYLKAVAEGISMLNVPFSIELDDDDWYMELAGAKGMSCTIKLTAPEKLNPKLHSFKDLVVGQCGNYLLTLNTGVIWANWLCLEKKTANELREISRKNKYVAEDLKEVIPIRPYSFLTDEDGFRLDCRQFNSLEELLEFAHEWGKS